MLRWGVRMDPIARVMSIAWVESELPGLEFRIEPITRVISIVTEVSRMEGR